MTTRSRAKKSLGQHWLTDSRVLRRIVAAAEIAPEDTVLEVGPGRGALTKRLAEAATRLIAVEKDTALAVELAQTYADADKVTVLERDVLETPVEEMLNAGGGGLPYVVVGNLPYNVGTAIIRRFLTAVVRPRRLVVMLQAEVAERIAAKPGMMSYLSAEMQLYAGARLLFRIPAKAFRPAPKVESAVLLLEVRDSPDTEVDDQAAFLALVQAGFAAPRKRLRNSLAVGLRVSGPEADAILEWASVEGEQRPAMLTLDQWRDVYYAYRAASRHG